MDEPESLKWSASFRFAPSAAKDLRGDKIILPQSALEQLLSAATSASTTASTQHNPYISTASRPSHAYYADSQQQLPHPLMFRLVNQTNGNVVHAGIREFSADEGQVLLSPYLMEALGLEEPATETTTDSNGDATVRDEEEESKNENNITIHAKQLPRGTYVRLRPLEAGYDPDDWKSLLERQLRESFTTLTKGAFLSVRGVKGETFRFLVDQFQPEGDGICVVDTDLEVDIEALNEEQARETMRQIMAKAQSAPGTAGGSSVGHEVDIWKPVSGQILAGDYVDYELCSWPRSRAIEVELSGLEDDDSVDLFVSPKSGRQRVVPRLDEHVFGVFAYTDSGCKHVVIQPSNIELEGAESLLISVYGYSSPEGAKGKSTPKPFELRVRSSNNSRAGRDQTPPKDEEHPEDSEQCQNCRQWVPKRTMMLHENFCRRNNISCAQCGEVFQKGSDEWNQHWHCPHDGAHGSSSLSKTKHDQIYHTEHRCQSCPFTTNAIPDLARHRTTLCPGKLILCQFCHLEVPQEGDPFNPSAETLLSGLTEHEIADGARTTDCHLCSKIIRLRDMATHLKHHDLEKAHRPRPQICRNSNCGRTLHGVGKNGAVGAGTHMGQGPGNDIGLCSLCFAPLYVSLHDPEGKALRRRIERRYLSQMMQGCVKRWCANEWCKTGRQNAKLEPKPSGTAAVLPLIKPLVEAFRDAAVPMHFCVDESNQRRRQNAELLAAEEDWDLEWCIAACEADGGAGGGGGLDRAHEWLVNWAPARA